MVDIETLVISQVLKSDENLEIAFITTNSWSDIQAAVGQKFISTLKKHLEKQLIKEFPELSNQWYFKDETEGNLLNLRIGNSEWNGQFEFCIIDEGDREPGVYFSVYSKDKDENICQNYHTKIYELFYEGVVNSGHWWSWAKDPYKWWYNDLKVLKEFAFSEQYPSGLSYFADRLIFFAKTIESLRNE